MALATSTILGIAAVAVAAAGTYVETEQASDAAAAQKNARQTAAAANTQKQQQDIRDQVRQNRIKTATILQASSDTGVTASSGAIGGTSSLATQSGANVGILNGNSYTGNAIAQDQQDAASATASAATFGQIARVGTTAGNLFFSAPSAKADLANIFGNGTPQY